MQILNEMPTRTSTKTDAAKKVSKLPKEDKDGMKDNDWIAFLPDATNGAIQYAKRHNLDLASCIKKLYMEASPKIL